MYNSRRLGAMLAFFALVVFAQSSGAARPAVIDPVVIRGDKLESLLGKSPDSIRAFSFIGGTFQPIPFQIDERMEASVYKSWTTRQVILTYAFDSGPEARPDPDPGFDRDDELVFMAFSAGARAVEGSGPPGSESCEEVVLHGRDGSESCVYVCSMPGNAPFSDQRYVSFNDVSIEGLGYSVGYPEGNPVNFDRLQSRDGQSLGKDVVDRFKLMVDVQVGLGIARYPLTDADYQHYLRGVRVGPVRVIREFETVLETWGGVQFRSYNHAYYYPYNFEYDMLARGAINWGKTFNMSHLSMAIDLDEAGRGMTFYSENNPRGEMVNGHSEPSELNMDYGPTEWAAVSGGEAGTLMVHLGLDRWTELYKDLYYADNDARGDPPENDVGMVGKFGYMLRNLQKAGFEPFPVRFCVSASREQYRPGLEDDFVSVYNDPLLVDINHHQVWSMVPDAPIVRDGRKGKPLSMFAEQKRGLLQSRFLLPSFIFDPNLLGSGPGVSYADIDFLGTGTFFSIGALWTERGYASYWVDFSELRFIKGVESFKASIGVSSFPAEPFYGIGNDTDKEDRTLYWWRRNEVNVTFVKYFGGIYGSDFRFTYKDVDIDSGIEPLSGTGTPSIEEHFGFDDELENGERWGPTVYGRQGGNHNGFKISLYRDMREARFLPKYGNYQEIELQVVSSALGADYDYVRANIDLRAYWHPDFLNPLPFWDMNVNPRRTFVTKWFGPDKNRAFAVRFRASRLFAEEIDWMGQEILDVPFYELTTIGSSSTLKGYTSKRFRDNDMVVGSIEYRWRWWRFEDIALFYDIGMVMDDLTVRENWEEEWHGGYGFSYRIHVPPHVIMTFEWGWSPEENAILHQANVGF